MAQLAGATSHNQKVAGLIPGQGIYLGCSFNVGQGAGMWDPQSGPVRSPIWACVGGNQSMFIPHMDVSLSPFFSPTLSF